MTSQVRRVLLVDFENRSRINLSVLDSSYSVIVFVGALQESEKLLKRAKAAHALQRVDLVKVDKTGKNALDFHIAFQIGRIYERAPTTEFVILSGDGGFDPLVRHVCRLGAKCRRVSDFEELVDEHGTADPVICPSCRQNRTIELNGGRWCVNCGRYAVRPEAAQLPSNQPGYREPETLVSQTRGGDGLRAKRWPSERAARLVCGWCSVAGDMSGGIYDDGEWMCGECLGQYSD